MNLDKVLMNLMIALISVLDLKNEGKSASVFDAHPITMPIFCVIFAIHGIFMLVHDHQVQQQQPNAIFAAILPKATLCSGSLCIVLLFMMILPVLGWSLLVLWVVCVAKVVLDELCLIFRLLLPYQVLQVILTFLREMTRRRTPLRQQNGASV